MIGHLLRSISKRKVGGAGWVRAPPWASPPVIYLSHHPVFLKYLEPTGRNSVSESESHSVLSGFLQLHGLYSLYNSPGQTTTVGSICLLQGIFPTQGSNPGLPHCRQILYQLSHKGSPPSESSPQTAFPLFLRVFATPWLSVFPVFCSQNPNSSHFDKVQSKT